ncbi:MAG TPA: hypothetical protein PLH03_04585 [Methylophilaceae bacterium]|nr:hypothetical protein [Methylophilaceae bacterium]
MAEKDRAAPASARSINASASELLAFARRYSEMSADGQKKEYAQVTQALSRNKSDLAARMKAALISGLPSSSFRDDAHALALLDGVLSDKKADADTQALAALLKDYLGESQKLADNAAKARQKSAEDQKHAADLQQKLDELKSIEKTLTERGQAGQK